MGQSSVYSRTDHTMKISAALCALVAGVLGDVTHHATISHGGVVVASGHQAPHHGPAVAFGPHHPAPVTHHAVHAAPVVRHHAVHAAPAVPHHAVHPAPVVPHHAVHASPVVPHHAVHPAPYHPDPYHEEAPKDYQFGYDVHGYDEYGNPNVHSRAEQRDGYNVKGQYRVELPDCRTQIVDYFVDEYKQYHADVKYEGVPCPDKSLLKHAPLVGHPVAHHAPVVAHPVAHHAPVVAHPVAHHAVAHPAA